MPYTHTIIFASIYAKLPKFRHRLKTTRPHCVFYHFYPASYLFRYEIPKAQLQALNSPSFSLIKSGAETITNYEIIKGSLKMTGR